MITDQKELEDALMNLINGSGTVEEFWQKVGIDIGVVHTLAASGVISCKMLHGIDVPESHVAACLQIGAAAALEAVRRGGLNTPNITI